MKSVTKHISFPVNLFEMIKTDAETFGVSFAEYIRHLAISSHKEKNKQNTLPSKWKQWAEKLPTMEVSEQQWQEWDAAKKEEGSIMTVSEFAKRYTVQ